MSIKTSLLTIISVGAVAAAAFPSFDAEKLDADSAGSLAAVAETFPSFNQNVTASFPLSGAKTTAASFPLLDAESDATAAAFLPWLFLLRLKRRLAPQAQQSRAKQTPDQARSFVDYCLADGGNPHDYGAGQSAGTPPLD